MDCKCLQQHCWHFTAGLVLCVCTSSIGLSQAEGNLVVVYCSFDIGENGGEYRF